MANGNDKRDWPLETLVTVMRNALQERGASGRQNIWGSTKGKRAEVVEKQTQPPGAPPFAPDLFDLVKLYPFTKGIVLTNDGVGYGEQTEVKVQCATGRVETKSSRRTRTGNFCLRLGPEPPAEAARSRPEVALKMPPDGGTPEELDSPRVPPRA
jgi:hypothetical protein